MVNEAEIKVKSLQKALEILNCFTKKSSWGVTEISEQLDLNKSNVHNILSTFKAMGYLDQDDESGRYKLGLSVYSLCYSLGQNLSIGSVAAPYLQELADMAGERVYLAIPHEQEIIYVTSAYPKTSIDLMRPIMGEHAQMALYRAGQGNVGVSSGGETAGLRSQEAGSLYRLYDHGWRCTVEGTPGDPAAWLRNRQYGT